VRGHRTEPIINSVIAAYAIDNIMQVLKNNTVSYCGFSTDTSSHSVVKVLPVVIQYFDLKFGGVQSERKCCSDRMEQQTVARYIKGTLEWSSRLLLGISREL
jgi:hypothetical protein